MLADSAVADGARIGPFAHLRPGSDIGEDAHVGNFVETKKASSGKRRQGQSPDLSRRCRSGGRFEYRRGRDHLQLRRGAQAHRRGLAKESLWAATRHWLRRLRSTTGPISAPAPASREDVPPGRWQWAERHQVNKEGWAERRGATKRGTEIDPDPDGTSRFPVHSLGLRTQVLRIQVKNSE